MKKSIFTLLFALLAVAGMAQIPSTNLKNLEGKTVDTSKLSNDGKPMVIAFFASWCKPCNRELTAISEVYEEWQQETGVKLFAVSIDQGQNAQKVKPFVDAKGWPFDILLDPNSDFKRALGIGNIPHSLVIDGEGKIVYSHSGYAEGAENDLYEEVKKACGK